MRSKGSTITQVKVIHINSYTQTIEIYIWIGPYIMLTGGLVMNDQMGKITTQ